MSFFIYRKDTFTVYWESGKKASMTGRCAREEILMEETTAQEIPDAVCDHGARGQTGSVLGDLVNPALSMGPGDPYVNVSHRLSC